MNKVNCSSNSEIYKSAQKKIEEANKNIKYRYIQGPKGDKGEQGIQGPTGPMGPKGENGPTTIQVGLTETTEPETEAMVTNVGTDKDVILNFKIPKGAIGETGPKGDKGDQGPRGFPGEIGISEVITIDGTETIEPNELAEVQDDFDNNIHHLTFYIPKGEKGEQGIQGIQGIQGPIGPTGPKGENGPTTIQVGLTETTEPETEAMVTNVGTDKEVILNFKIPKGATGETGPKGDQGEQGPIGPQGPAGPTTTTAYAMKYLDLNQDLALPADMDVTVPLNNEGPALFAEYNTEHAIDIKSSSFYQVSYLVNATPKDNCELSISAKYNDLTLPASNINVSWKANTNNTISNSFIAALANGDVLTLNIRAKNNTTLSLNNSGNITYGTSAVLSIAKIH